ncbi:hypothetical protein [Afipia carboxidovorans]|uniref:hypothetical protein n=1 Tax=Afipia carboxidovorans TaxID=40137 RepID=UPI0030882122|nr:hypothetical protein CRBSH125_09650 [Afipia carboxidovorans]
MIVNLEPKSVDELERDDIVRQVKEAIAKRLESEAGNEVYLAAWRRAAKLVRSMEFKSF